MLFIIALAIYGVGVDVVVPIFLFGLVVWYGVFLNQVLRTLTIDWESKPLANCRESR